MYDLNHVKECMKVRIIAIQIKCNNHVGKRIMCSKSEIRNEF
jgi:hypothetical protein